MPGCRTGAFTTESYFCFIHLTLQEFLAARWLVVEGKLPGIMKMTKLGATVVLQFVCGLLLQKGTLSLKITAEDTIICIVNELLESYEYLVTSRCLFEYGDETVAQGVLEKHDLSDIIIDDSYMYLSDSDCAALAYLLSVDVVSSRGIRTLSFCQV